MALTPGNDATISATLKVAGAPVSIPLTAVVTAQMFKLDGTTSVAPARTLSPNTAGANWLSGVVVAEFPSIETILITESAVIVQYVVTAPTINRSWSVRVPVDGEGDFFPSLLFPDRVGTLAKMRRDYLLVAATGVMPGLNLSDEYLWDKLRAAEAEMAHELRVPLVPTRFFPIQPTAQELAALNGGAWAIDPGYDYDPDMFRGDKWGYVVTRHRPIISVQYMRFCYPTQDQGFFDVPREWLRIDARVGHIRIIPASAGILVGSAGFALSTLIHRRSVPDMVQISYTAGLKDAALNFPELLDAVKKKAILKIMMDVYLPQSGSISADGLSQSLSVDMSRYEDAIDSIINGGKGSNGGMMAAIHGVRGMVF